MGSCYEDRQQLADKIDDEGGLESFLYYGIRAEDVPMSDTPLRMTIWKLLRAWEAYQLVANEFTSLLPDPYEQ